MRGAVESNRIAAKVPSASRDSSLQWPELCPRLTCWAAFEHSDFGLEPDISAFGIPHSAFRTPHWNEPPYVGCCQRGGCHEIGLSGARAEAVSTESNGPGHFSQFRV